jgi:hypothetical protein
LRQIAFSLRVELAQKYVLYMLYMVVLKQIEIDS